MVSAMKNASEHNHATRKSLTFAQATAREWCKGVNPDGR